MRILSQRGRRNAWRHAITLKPMLIATAWLGLAIGLMGQSRSSTPPVVTGDARVDRLLSQMTLEEKIALIHGGQEATPSGVGQAGTWPGLPRLGIPSLRLADGPPGVSVSVWSTGMTATMGLAATWSREDARKNGIVIARDAKALGQDVVLEPFVNIVRDFTFGRAHNTFGEDPLLAGQIAAAQIAGTQGEGIMSQIKHYVAYEGGNDVIVDPQTLREIYLAPFADAAAVDVSSVMCSYNKVNGPYACGNGEVQNKILRGEAGFKGFITSDWGATHGTLFINEGLDLEMPGGTFFAAVPGQGGRGGRGGAGGAGGAGGVPAGAPGTAAGQRGQGAPGGAAAANPGGVGRGGAAMPEERATGAQGGRGGGGGRGGDPPPIGMLEAVRAEQVKESTITMAVGRILVQMDKFGLLDKAPKHTITEQDSAFNALIVQKTGEDAATLLKNQDHVLPLTNTDLSSVAFIGPTAGQLVSIGQAGERAQGIPDHQVGPVSALEKITGRKVTYAVANDFDGTPIPASALSNGGKPGLLRTNPATSETQTDAELNFTRSNNKALPPGTSCTWTGTLTIPSDGTYMIAFQSRASAGSVMLDGNSIVAASGGGRGGGAGAASGATATSLSSAPPAVARDRRGLHPISSNIVPTKDTLNNARTRIELKAGSHELTVTSTGEQNGDPVQVRLAWVSPQEEHANYEAAITAAMQAKKAVVFAWGRDRPEVFKLPGDQDKLIADVAAVNPNTIVVLNTSLPVAMPWIDKVKGVLQMWWPGDEGGPATANILLGRANPAGRLPITWPLSLAQMVANDPAHPERSSQGVDGKTTYSEGLFMGYRWFDKQNLQPRFPFGHGLSYTSFEYSGLKLARAKDGGLEVTFSLRNTGRVAGDEVPQVYLGAPKTAPSGAQFAARALVQFDRVTVSAGQSKSIMLHVPLRQLQYWATTNDRWETATGGRTVYVGASSRDLRLQADINISARAQGSR